MRSLRARGTSYFLIRRKVAIFPSVLPRAPAITVGIKRSDPVATKYPQITYKNCDDGKLTEPLVSMRIKIAMYEPVEISA